MFNMANIENIETIAKILAKATSDIASEADSAIVSAINRMKRDGIELEDLLRLDEKLLYQETLIILVGQIVKSNNQLSIDAKRELYKKYFSLVNDKFCKANDGQTSYCDMQYRKNDNTDLIRKNNENSKKIQQENVEYQFCDDAKRLKKIDEKIASVISKRKLATEKSETHKKLFLRLFIFSIFLLYIIHLYL